MSAAEDVHQDFVDQLIGRGALWSRQWIDAFRATPRHVFLERVFWYQRDRNDPSRATWREVDTRNPGPAALRLLYSDRALTTRLSEPTPGRPATPISSSSQPSLMAQMLEDLRLAPGMRVLEVGAGTGYNAALLAKVAGAVVAVDVDRRVLAEAANHLRAFPDRRVDLHHADGRMGWPPGAPYDRILVTAATPDLEPAWLEQLARGGLLVAPLELAPGLAYLVRGGPAVSGGWAFEGRLTRPAYFMPLRLESESGREAGSPAALLPPPDRLTSMPAPWAAWVRRRLACGSPGLLPALAFLGHLEGLTVAGFTGTNRQTFFAAADLVRGNVCWLGETQWRVSGDAGAALGAQLWQRFLDAGGPWPTEFRLQVAPLGTAGTLPAGDSLAFRRQGPRLEQLWELIEPRDRLPGD
jgi:protein-L-isoaspartate O-methyltransferase